MKIDESYPLAKKALEAFGEDVQFLALIEELGEAAAAVARYKNGKGDIQDIRSEIVDVESVVASLRDILGHPQAWVEMRALKRAKLARKLESGVQRTADDLSCEDCGVSFAIEPIYAKCASCREEDSAFDKERFLAEYHGDSPIYSRRSLRGALARSVQGWRNLTVVQRDAFMEEAIEFVEDELGWAVKNGGNGL